MRTPDQVAAMNCPVCNVSLAMSDRQGIEIDYCPQCRGVWLDRGELDKIIERSIDAAPAARPQPAPPQPGYPPQAHGHYSRDYKHGHGYKRKKSWLDEIFD